MPLFVSVCISNPSTRTINGTISKELFLARMRPLNTTLDYGWILYGDKEPHLKLFSAAYFGNGQKNISVNNISCFAEAAGA